jgi:hypothetical protein
MQNKTARTGLQTGVNVYLLEMNLYILAAAVTVDFKSMISAIDVVAHKLVVANAPIHLSAHHPLVSGWHRLLYKLSVHLTRRQAIKVHPELPGKWVLLPLFASPTPFNNHRVAVAG